MRTIDWVSTGSGQIRLIDQTLLPSRTEFLDIRTVSGLIDAIQRLAIRGAPALGVAGAMGVALAVTSMSDDDARAVISRLRDARPTAVNLAGGVDIALAAYTADGPPAALAAALQVRDDDIAACLKMAERGVDQLGELVP